MAMARAMKVCRQPISSSKACTPGTKKNIPKDVEAMIVPNTRLRRSFGTTLPTAPRTSTWVGPLSPRPTSRPSDRNRSKDEVTWLAHHRPRA